MEKKINLDWLLRLRVVVARCGEMDAQRWWNTEGQLGPYGAKVLRRGFPRTHYFAQARSVFAVAAHRCTEIFAPPNAVTFWRLSDEVEEAFDARWEGWLDAGPTWAPFFESVAATAMIRSASLRTNCSAASGQSSARFAARWSRLGDSAPVMVPGTIHVWK